MMLTHAQDIISTRDRFPTDTRLLAVISLKNVAHQFWRLKTAKYTPSLSSVLSLFFIQKLI